MWLDVAAWVICLLLFLGCGERELSGRPSFHIQTTPSHDNDGSNGNNINAPQVEIRSLERYQELKEYILARRDELTGRKRDNDKGGKAPSIMDLDADDAAVGLGGGGGAKSGKGFA